MTKYTHRPYRTCRLELYIIPALQKRVERYRRQTHYFIIKKKHLNIDFLKKINDLIPTVLQM